MPQDTAFQVGGVTAAPLGYTVPGTGEVLIKQCYAHFDGTAAGAAFYPCVRIRAPGGTIMAEYVAGSTVAAGASADVTFFPGLTPAASSGNGIQFGGASPVYGAQNTGVYLDVTTSGTDPFDADGSSINITTNSTGNMGIQLVSNGATTSHGIFLSSQTDIDISSFGNVKVSGTEVDITGSLGSGGLVAATTSLDPSVLLRAESSTGATVVLRSGAASANFFKGITGSSAALNKVGIYNATPVVQPAAIPAPTGGATVDTQARTAITSILNAIGQAAGGIGITA